MVQLQDQICYSLGALWDKLAPIVHLCFHLRHNDLTKKAEKSNRYASNLKPSISVLISFTSVQKISYFAVQLNLIFWPTTEIFFFLVSGYSDFLSQPKNIT
ncbi:hypothetical protein AMECASPLE_008418 [Ameca splendens]|uniref:Uncharacterized protein n=1 Tax=Ameca splendens TaxID=208324 RepID=A0ABV0XD15_9TELE